MYKVFVQHSYSKSLVGEFTNADSVNAAIFQYRYTLAQNHLIRELWDQFSHQHPLLLNEEETFDEELDRLRETFKEEIARLKVEPDFTLKHEPKFLIREED